MQEKKTLSSRDSLHTFTGFSGAEMYTSAGQGIQCISYIETNKPKERIGHVVFLEDTLHGYMNFCINFKNEYGHHVYVRLTAPKLYDEDGNLIPPNVPISKDKLYMFKYSQLWRKVYDGEYKIDEYYQ